MKALATLALLAALYAFGLDRVFAALDTLDVALRAAYAAATPQLRHPERRSDRVRHAREAHGR